MAVLVDSINSDHESREEWADLPVRKCRHQHENSDEESGVSLMERQMMTRSRMTDKNISTFDTEASTESRAGRLSTHKDDLSERRLSQLSHMKRGANRSTGRVVNKDIQVKTHTGPPDDCIGGTVVTIVSMTERKS